MKYVIVRHNGATSKVDAIGFTGQGCQAATAAIEAALGQKVSGEEKPEFFQTITPEQQVGQGGES